MKVVHQGSGFALYIPTHWALDKDGKVCPFQYMIWLFSLSLSGWSKISPLTSRSTSTQVLSSSSRPLSSMVQQASDTSSRNIMSHHIWPSKNNSHCCPWCNGSKCKFHCYWYYHWCIDTSSLLHSVNGKKGRRERWVLTARRPKPRNLKEIISRKSTIGT